MLCLALAGPSSAPGTATSAITTTTNPRIPSPSFQPPYPSPSPIEPSNPQPQVRVTSPTRWSLRNALIGGGNPDLSSTFASPFRSRSGTGGSSIARGRPRRPSAARLWNPSNSTPRGPSSTRRRRQSVDRVIAIPLQHPDLNSPREGAAAGGEYPLLTLPEQRQKRHSGSTRASLQVERSGSSSATNRVSLPRSVSIDIVRNRSGENSPRLDKGKGKAVDEEREDTLKQLERKPTTGYRKRGQTISSVIAQETSGISFDKGKEKANMSGDVERGPDALDSYEAVGTSTLPNNGSRTSFQSGIGAAMSDNTSIIGSDGPPMNPGEEWGPQHPCFPHMNPHVPLSSPLYQTTRIIRIRRDWMIEGDLAPTFSNLYPEILDPAGVSEQEFRTLVERVNNELIPAFSPWNFRNLVDGVLGLLTGWIWDDLGFTAVKSRLNNVERYLEEWNREMEGRSKEGPGSAPRVVPLRRTGYMNLDIQVPDPEVSYPVSNPGDDRTATGLSHNTQ
ncbi:Golgin subfamily A member 7/ERF4 family-domain-containing protein [Cadophora sp. MPI-SDFR-AT-0126]|nr:Golgin subfamily A member 7/ERF4 family-domain-containing protein [Leotiomycetes sp. MPI-SDFR-AT-0126]